MSRVLVTGATGFLGCRLVRRLAERGDQVVAMHREGSDTSLIDDLLADDRVERALGDLGDLDSLREAMHGCDVVFHTAGDVSYWGRHRERQHRVNVEGTRHVVTAAREAGVGPLVHTSSVAAIGIPEGGRPADESHEWNADRKDIAYFTTKRLAEGIVREACAAGLDAVMVNPSYVVGPGDVRLHDGNVFIDLHRRTIPLCPPGGNCWVDVDDVVEGHLLALERGRTGERYILGGDNLPYREVFATIGEHIDRRPPPIPLIPLFVLLGAPIYEAIGAIRNRYPRMTRESGTLLLRKLYFDSSKAREELGYEFRPFGTVVERTVAWYREHGYLPAETSR